MGYRFIPYVGVEGELSAGVGDDHIDLGGVRTGVHVNDQYAGYAVGFLPVTPNADLLARIGYGATDLNLSQPGRSFHDSVTSWNAGVGGQYFFDGKRTGSAPTIPARPPIARTWTPTSGRWPTSGSSSSPEPSLRGAERGPPLSRKRQARGRPFKQALAAEAEQLGRAPAGLGVPAAEALDQVGALEPPAEILLVQGDPGDRLHCALELREGELRGA